MTVIAFGRIPLTPDQCLVDGVDGGGSAPLTHRCVPSSYLKTSRYLVSSMSYLMYFFSCIFFQSFFFLLFTYTHYAIRTFFLYATSRTCSTSSDTLARFFSFNPFQNVFFCFFLSFQNQIWTVFQTPVHLFLGAPRWRRSG